MVMGSQEISAWDEAWHRSGRVVFAIRRGLAFGGLFIVLVPAALPIVSIVRDLDSRGTWFTIRVAALAVILVAWGALAVLVVLGHPRVTVDPTGIRYAWWRRIPWPDFAGATLVRPASGLAAPYLTITSTHGAELHIPQTNVEDLGAFAAWLGKLNVQRRLTMTGTAPAADPPQAT